VSVYFDTLNGEGFSYVLFIPLTVWALIDFDVHFQKGLTSQLTQCLQATPFGIGHLSVLLYERDPVGVFAATCSMAEQWILRR